jgi:hypothetical protein
VNKNDNINAHDDIKEAGELLEKKYWNQEKTGINDIA